MPAPRPIPVRAKAVKPKARKPLTDEERKAAEEARAKRLARLRGDEEDAVAAEAVAPAEDAAEELGASVEDEALEPAFEAGSSESAMEEPPTSWPRGRSGGRGCLRTGRHVASADRRPSPGAGAAHRREACRDRDALESDMAKSNFISLSNRPIGHRSNGGRSDPCRWRPGDSILSVSPAISVRKRTSPTAVDSAASVAKAFACARSGGRASIPTP